jgi:lipopolysaccharide/colanic/teichoic acid biosynthesis glycosyltransferase
MLRRLATRIHQFLIDSDVPQTYGFRCADEFALALEIERHRADRDNGGFSLLTITPAKGASARAAYPCLAGILQKRLRLTDLVGWLDDRRIGVIFPNTPAEGAWRVADDVCAQFPEQIPAPDCSVLLYPSDDRVGGITRDDGNGQGQADEKPVEAMEMLFVAPMPRLKRLVDVVGSAVGLVLLSPLFLVTAIAVKCTSPGPIFFSQDRTGLGGRRFRIYKFRSMVANAESIKESLAHRNIQDGPAFKIENDPRITRMGRFLRKTAIDELPQLWNVLRGDMSLVGPRPLPCNESVGCRQWQRRRLDVTPGVTCTWQVFGGTKVTFAEWMRMDLRYARKRSLWKDVRLLVLTIPSIIRRRTVY